MSRSLRNLRKLHHVSTIIYGLVLGLTNCVNGTPSNKESRSVTKHVLCKTDACQLTALEIIEKMNDSVNPCENFYEFACGRYSSSGFIPPHQDEYDVRTLTQDTIGEQLRLMLEASPAKDEPKTFKKLKAYYKNCLEKDGPDDTGSEDLKKLFKQLGGWPLMEGSSWDGSHFNWKQMMMKFRDVGLNHDHFIRIVVVRDENDSSKKSIYINPPGVDLPHPELANLNTRTLRLTLDRMAELTRAFGIDTESAIESLEEVALFMVDLYKAHSSPSLHPGSSLNFTNIRELQKKYPVVHWRSYINGTLPPSMQATDSDRVIIFNPEYFNKLDSVISSTNKKTLANYLFYREAEMFAKFTKLQADNSTSNGDNTLFCMNQVSPNFPYVLSAMYVKEFFDNEKMPIMKKIVYEIEQQYRRILNQSKWIDNTTKAHAMEKFSRMHSFVGHADDLLDYAKLDTYYDSLMIHPRSFLKTQLSMMIFTSNHHYKDMMNIYHTEDWFRKFGNSFSILPEYSPVINRLVVPTGFFKKLGSEKDYPRYMRYGYFGPHIAYEITHGLDRDGNLFEEMGQPNHLWTSDSKENYKRVAECVDRQYEKYIFNRYNLAGKSNQITNFADNLGVKTAYAAYKQYLMLNGGDDHRLPGLEKYTPQRMFWIAYANSMCARYTPEGLRNRIMKGEDVINEYRVLGPISNSPSFLKDFDCKPDSWAYQADSCDI